MSSLQFVLHPTPETDDQLKCKLKDVSDNLNAFGQPTGNSPTLNWKGLVQQIVVGQNHFAFLFEDGHVCRLEYSVIVDRLDLTKPDLNENGNRKKTVLSQKTPLYWSSKVELWPEPSVKFIHIAQMYTALVALSSTGEIYQWKWNETEPYKHSTEASVHHPKTIPLRLLNEKIVILSASGLRCSLLTESGKVATFLDETLNHGVTLTQLEHPAIDFSDFIFDHIVSLYTCSLYTVAKLESGSLYWWGVLPFAQRKKVWEKYRVKSHKRRPSSCTKIVTGCQVYMKHSPMYQPGAIGFNISGVTPKVGMLQNSAWNLTDVCRFKILVAPTKVTNTNYRSMSMATPRKDGIERESIATELQEKNEEDWPLKDVIFVEDVKNLPVGHVLKVVGAFAVVQFPNEGDAAMATRDRDAYSKNIDLPINCRLIKKVDLQIMKANATFRVPNGIQKLPSRVDIPGKETQILSVTVDGQGIHAIFKFGSQLCYEVYNIATGWWERLYQFSNDTLNRCSENMSLWSTGDCKDAIIILHDGNRMICPLNKNNWQSGHEPQWLDLRMIRYLGLGTHKLASILSSDSNHTVAILIFDVVLPSNSDNMTITLREDGDIPPATTTAAKDSRILKLKAKAKKLSTQIKKLRSALKERTIELKKLHDSDMVECHEHLKQLQDECTTIEIGEVCSMMRKVLNQKSRREKILFSQLCKRPLANIYQTLNYFIRRRHQVCVIR